MKTTLKIEPDEGKTMLVIGMKNGKLSLPMKPKTLSILVKFA
ncbi:MAG: hypothetical protein ACRC2T_07560 [Thermoguttaceae bacterium]